MLIWASQTKSVQVSVEALASGVDPALPPLMNPAMLEASDDLTNLSHLNEPAGVYNYQHHSLSLLVIELQLTGHNFHSPTSYPTPICTEGNLHIQRHRPHRDKSVRKSGLVIRARHGSGIRGKAKSHASTTSFRYRRRVLHVCTYLNYCWSGH